MEVGGNRFTYVEVSGRFHGSTSTLPPSVEVEASITSIICSLYVYYGSFHELPYTPPYCFYFYEYCKTSCCLYKTSIGVHRLPFDQRLWNFNGNKSTSMEANLLP